MGVSLRKTDDGPWVPVGEWFEQLVELPRALLEFENNNNVALTKILLAVPSRSLVSNAVAWGFSKYAFENPQIPPESSPIANILPIPVGTKVRLTFPIGRGVNSKQFSESRSFRNTIVGIFQGAALSGALVKANVDVNGERQHLGLTSAVRFSIESDKTPQGSYFEPIYSGADERAARRNFFNSQQNPQALFLTEIGAFQEELDFSFIEPSLVNALGEESLKLDVAVRIDRFSNDRYSHFINVWENAKEFDDFAPELSKVIDAFNLVVLDGNLSLDLLAQNEYLRHAKVLGVFETGRNLIQERGASAFLGEAMYSSPIKDFESLLKWRAPDGIKIWGWSQ
jgi:hypothetical protein